MSETVSQLEGDRRPAGGRHRMVSDRDDTLKKHFAIEGSTFPSQSLLQETVICRSLSEWRISVLIRHELIRLGTIVLLLFISAVPAQSQWINCNSPNASPDTCTNSNVGIGTQDATSPLTVNGSASIGGLLGLTLPGTGTLLWASSNGGGSVALTYRAS